MHPQVDEAEFRTRLGRLRASTLQLLSEHRKRAAEAWQGIPGDEIDQAIYDSLLSHDRRFAQREFQRIEAIDDALHRLDRGTYGHCLECDDLIDLERLRAAPEIALCVSCAEARGEERARRGEERL